MALSAFLIKLNRGREAKNLLPIFDYASDANRVPVTRIEHLIQDKNNRTKNSSKNTIEFWAKFQFTDCSKLGSSLISTVNLTVA